MRTRHRNPLSILRSRSHPGLERFRRLRDRIAAGGGTRGLREFLLELNRDLAGAREAEGEVDAARAAELCLELLAANPDATAAEIGALLEETGLRFGDPLVGAIFESAPCVPALLGVLSDVVETEQQLLQFRVRAMEALVTRSRAPADTETEAVGLAVQPALRFLNGVLDELEKGPAGGAEEAFARWAEGILALPLQDCAAGDRPLLDRVGAALGLLGTAPAARETMTAVLELLRANAPLPGWHPAATSAPPPEGPGSSVSALVVDKALQIVLAAAAARWRTVSGHAGARPARPEIQPWPVSEQTLESTLLDVRQPPRTRAMAASLLRLLAHASPAMRLSGRAALYASLFLDPRSEAADDAGDAAAEEPPLDLLLEAMSDECGAIRRAAGEACRRAAARDPAAFEPRHYAKLLPILSVDDAAMRDATMRTFQALAGFRRGRLAEVVDDIAARLHGDDDLPDDEEGGRRDLERALGITMDRLVGDVERLQREVTALESRRRELLRYIESQAVRVGEEIHLEVLNTLTGYLATAVDERDYDEASRRLDGLVAELRRIMNNLYPRDLETEGFLQTLRNRLRDTENQMRRVVPGGTARLASAPSITDATVRGAVAEPAHLVLLYRIVLEAVVNARKHAKATSIGVSIDAPEAGALEIAIQDDGGGRGGPFRENVGMALMRQRAEEIGAAIAYDAAEDGGTRVRVRLSRPDVAPVPRP